MPADRVYKCRVRPCQNVKGVSNHWLVVTIDKLGRLTFERFTKVEEFIKAANRHGAIEICSEACLHVHLGRWAAGKITSAERPGCPSPAVLEIPAGAKDGTFTCWVSDVYRSHATWNKDIQGQYSETRIVNYMDDGQKRSMWCFQSEVFDVVDLTAGHYATFKVKRKGEYVNITGVIKIEEDQVSLPARRAATR
jgi:hypothetical protein